jgi:hypothetical protein
LWGISKAKVIQMNHQSENTGLYVENPLELQMLFGDQIFIDERDKLVISVQQNENTGHELDNSPSVTNPIAFFMDLETTRLAGFSDIAELLGRMLLVTQLDGKVPTMELADIFDIVQFSEEQFSEKVKTCRKIIVFADHWPFQQNIAEKQQIISMENVQLFYASSIPSIMANNELKKAFAAGLKNYFLAG